MTYHLGHERHHRPRGGRLSGHLGGDWTADGVMEGCEVVILISTSGESLCGGRYPYLVLGRVPATVMTGKDVKS